MWDYCGLWWFFPKYQVIQKLGNLSRGVFLSKGRILDVQYIYIPIQGPLNKTRDKPVPGILYYIYIYILYYIYTCFNYSNLQGGALSCCTTRIKRVSVDYNSS